MSQIASALASMEPVDPSILNFAGDGDFLMNGQELATAVQYGAAVLFIVFHNGSYGTIRMHQERDYPARVSGTQLKNPDFAALARERDTGNHPANSTAAQELIRCLGAWRFWQDRHAPDRNINFRAFLRSNPYYLDADWGNK
jgi:thiamine pyrophosphate-dependent acetolactate synthase large subunit-like protein